jgi:hypothetical protein
MTYAIYHIIYLYTRRYMTLIYDMVYMIYAIGTHTHRRTNAYMIAAG